MVYPEFFGKRDLVLATGNIEIDSQESRWPAYEAILTNSTAWDETRQPIILPEGEFRLARWPELAHDSEEWMWDGR
jgi:hypothetical protein